MSQNVMFYLQYKRILFSYALGIVFANALDKGDGVVPRLHLLGEATRICKKDQIYIRHSEVGLKKRIDDERAEFIGESQKSGRADTSDEEAGLPSELNKNTDGEQPRDIDALFFFSLPEIIQDKAEVSDKQYDGHVTVIFPGGTLNDDVFRTGRCESAGKLRADKPPEQDKKRPCEKVLVL